MVVNPELRRAVARLRNRANGYRSRAAGAYRRAYLAARDRRHTDAAVSAEKALLWRRRAEQVLAQADELERRGFK